MSALRVWEVGNFYCEDLRHPLALGVKKAGDLVWLCPESAGSVLTTLVSI